MARAASQDEELRFAPERRHTISQCMAGKAKSLNYDASIQPRDFDVENTPAPILDAPLFQNKSVPWKLGMLYDLIPGRLSFSVHFNDTMTIKEIKTHKHLFFFSCDCQEQYEPFCWDFGPVNIGVVHTFCMYVRSKLSDPRLQNKHLVYYSDVDAAHRTNAAFLLSAFLLIEHKMQPADAVRPFTRISPSPFINFRDASNGVSAYDLSFVSCVEALHCAMAAGWYAPESFDADEYEAMEHPEVDIHVICPKLLAFKGPRTQPLGGNDGGAEEFDRPPADYLDIFKAKNVHVVVRLNEPSGYAPVEFSSHGMEHRDLFFEDCTAPSDALLEQFLDLVDDRTHGMLAVHCFAGLGRTGTLIAAWIMKNFKFSADQAIGWLRLCRPGSVIGPQQAYLESLQGVQWVGNRPVRKGAARARRSLTISGNGSNEQGAAEMARQFAEAATRRGSKR